VMGSAADTEQDRNNNAKNNKGFLIFLPLFY
jgi:hypothetical protein